MDEAAAADQREKARMKRLARFASPTSPPQGPGLADASPPPPQLRATSSSSSDVFEDRSPQSTPRGAAGATPPHKKAALSSVSATDAAASSPRQAKSPGAVASAALVRVLQVIIAPPRCVPDRRDTLVCVCASVCGCVFVCARDLCIYLLAHSLAASYFGNTPTDNVEEARRAGRGPLPLGDSLKCGRGGTVCAQHRRT